MIRVEGLTHSFAGSQVLSDVWFSVPRGEVLGFIGPNGAGKTTTMRMMATLLEPDIGRILVDGVDVADDPVTVRRIVGFMPDGFGVYERITVREYLEFFAAAHGLEVSSRAGAVDAVVELTGLGTLRERLVAALSKGMRQRLAIARMLLHDPKVLLLDEPANGLDPRARIEMRELIEQLQQLGKTIVVSSHILTELSDMVSSVVILERGTVLAAGPVDRIGRELRPDRIVRLRLLHHEGQPEQVLLAVSGVSGCERAPDGDLRVTYSGGDDTVAEIVRAAVQGGLRVVRVETERSDLEHIFLEVTRGELQ